MRLLRHLLGPLALLLALIVAGEVTDLVPCADTACGVWSVVFGDGTPGDAGGPLEGPDMACLCHVSFTPTATVPLVPAPGTLDLALLLVVVGGVSAGAPDVPHPPPLG